jgi:hypothetical protein
MTLNGLALDKISESSQLLLKTVAKCPRRKAQKQHDGSAHELQSTQCLVESLMIGTIHLHTWGKQEDSGNTDETDTELVTL